jgi:cytochrome c
MKKTIITLTIGGLLAGSALASEELAKAKNCMTCHSFDKKIVGPSYKDVIAKRSVEKGAEATMAAKIKNGSKGDWGTVPMPPNNVTEAEALTLAKWVLAHK